MELNTKIDMIVNMIPSDHPEVKNNIKRDIEDKLSWTPEADKDNSDIIKALIIIILCENLKGWRSADWAKNVKKAWTSS